LSSSAEKPAELEQAGQAFWKQAREQINKDESLKGWLPILLRDSLFPEEEGKVPDIDETLDALQQEMCRPTMDGGATGVRI
jgi:hypothetical protein